MTLQHGSIPEIVSSIAALTPSHPAVLQQDSVLDYATLNRRANQVAHYLLSRGAGPEIKVGISIGRSIEFVIAALGILKSGAAYVPIDPSYPEARRSLIANDAGLLLSVSVQSVREVHAGAVENVSLHSPEVQSQPASEPQVGSPDPDDLAYVIYTSGSTGVPKGVEVTHANLQHLIRWHTEAFHVTAADRSTLLANVGFDAAVWELWPYLCAGSTLLVPLPEIVRQPEALCEFIVANEVAIVYAPTLLAEALLECEWPETMKLRAILTGGDALRISPRPGLAFALINNYGPAECTVVSTSGEIAQSKSRPEVPSIGKAIAGAQVYLLDGELNEVAAAAPGGDLYRRGRGCAGVP